MRTTRKQLPVPLSRPEKRILTRLAVVSGLSCSAVIRQLLLREHQAPREEKTLATREAR
jgi:hypothetical protein